MIINRVIVLLVFFLLLTPGCAVHRSRAIGLPSPLPDSFIEENGKTTKTQPIEKWWETFNDPKLNSVMDEAFTHNLDIAQAFARLKQFEAMKKTATSSKFPYLNAEGQGRRERQPSFAGDNLGNSYQLSVAAGYELDLWKKVASGSSAASLEFEASREDIKALYMSLSAQVAELYYLAVEQRAQMDLTDQTIESFRDVVERVELRYKKGLVPALDVYQARENLSIAEARLPVFKENLAVTEHALAVLLGQYPDRETAGDLAEIPDMDKTFPVGLPADVITCRPDVQSAFLRVKASDARVAAAIADRFPSFNLLGSYGRSSTSFPTGDIKGIFWNLIINAALPIVDGGRRRAEVDRSEAVFEENLAIYYKTVLTALQEVEDALVKNRTSEERIAKLTERVDASSSARRITLQRYLHGLSEYLPVLTQQQLFFNSESALLEAERQLISARIQLARALGGAWMDKEIEKRLTTEYTGKESDQ